MSRLINTETAGKNRTRLSKEVVLSIRELMKQTSPDDTSKDLAAHIVLALQEIADGVETSVVAWEKRDYWVKADRFRMEWGWAQRQSDALRQSLKSEDWGNIALLAIQIGQKFSAVKISDNHRLGKPWVGAYKRLILGKI